MIRIRDFKKGSCALALAFLWAAVPFAWATGDLPGDPSLSMQAPGVVSVPPQQKGNERIPHFASAKKLAYRIHQSHPVTIYCQCRYQGHDIDLQSCGYESAHKGQRSQRLEWEHIVPADVFGHTFPEWTGGSPRCMRKGKPYKGRRCARTQSEFRRMEADLYNLWPVVGDLNGARSDYPMADLGAEKWGQGDFGGCRAKVKDHQFEPMPDSKGRVARAYFYMEAAYPSRIQLSPESRQLFSAWDAAHPVDAWECERAAKIEAVQGNPNLLLQQKCQILEKNLRPSQSAQQESSS
jgi:deoxyribonuclease-1